ILPLERDGLIEIGASLKDRRRREVRLTPAGAARLRAARQGWKEAQQRFDEVFGPERAAALRDLLREVTASEFTATARSYDEDADAISHSGARCVPASRLHAAATRRQPERSGAGLRREGRAAAKLLERSGGPARRRDNPARRRMPSAAEFGRRRRRQRRHVASRIRSDALFWEVRGVARGARQLKDMHAVVRAIDNVNITAIVDLDIVGLDDLGAVLLAIVELGAALVAVRRHGRDVIGEFLRMVWVADIDRPHAGIEMREEHDPLVI